MAANIKKASSVIRKSFRSKRYAAFEKENVSKTAGPTKVVATTSSSSTTTTGGTSQHRTRSMSTSAWSGDENQNGDTSTLANLGTPPARSQLWLKRGTSMTQSMRDVVGNLRQKLKISTRRSRLNATPTKVGIRRHTIGGREARLHSALKASTPTRNGRTHIKTSLSVETPTRLRREVESLTANMQALNALTPNTLEGRTRTRKTPPLTNGSLKTARLSHKRVSQV